MQNDTTLDELFAKFEGAFAENTMRAYRADFVKFQTWCEEAGYSPFDCSPTSLAEYVEQVSAKQAPATVSRNIASLSTVLKLSGHEDPTKSPEVVLALKRMYRQKGRFQKQATPLTREILEQLLAVCSDDLRGRRDALMLRLGNETMRRRSELCGFKFEDLEQLPNGKTGIRLKFSKTDQLGKGKLIPISNLLYKQVTEWGKEIGSTGYILRSVNKHGRAGKQLCPASISRRLQQLQQLANLEGIGTLSGHSFRVGGALDLLDQGETLEKIMLRGGWQAESTAIKYLREWGAM
jgi:site-specific recombinase XerD